MAILVKDTIPALRTSMSSLADTAEAYYPAKDELDAVKAELVTVKAELVTVKAELVTVEAELVTVEAELEACENPPPPSILPSVMPTMSVADLRKRVALNVQLPRTDMSYSYEREDSWARVLRMTDYLGTKRIRSMGPNGGVYDPAAWDAMAAGGAKMTLLIQGTTTYALARANLLKVLRLEQLWPGCVEAVEGENEPANFSGYQAYKNRNGTNFTSGQSGTATKARQDELYWMVKSSSEFALLKDKPVVHFTTGNSTVIDADSDYWNGHNYPGLFTPQTWTGSGVADSSHLPQRLRNGIVDHLIIDPRATNRPVWITEIGWCTHPPVGYVDDPTQARCSLIYWWLGSLLGIQSMHFYEGYDSTYTDSVQGWFGMWGRAFNNQDGVPKQSAVAIHNAMAIFGTDGAVPAEARYNLTLPTTGKSMLLQGTNRHLLLIWNEAPFWNPATKTAIAVTPGAMALEVEAGKTVEWFNPMTGLAALSTPPTQLGADPLIVRIK